MKLRKLRRLLEKTDDKLSIFTNKEILKKYNTSEKEFFDLIDNFLNDEEKLKLFDYPYFQKSEILTKSGILNLISDENIIFKILHDDNIINNFNNYQIFNIIEKLSDEKKNEILINKDFATGKLHLEDEQIANLTKKLTDEDLKIKVLETYEFEKNLKIKIISTFSYENKLKIILNEKKIGKYDLIKLFVTLDTKKLSEFFVNNREFLNENDICPYEVIRFLTNERQKEFIDNIENTDLSLNEKKEIFVVIDDAVKQSIDYKNLPKEYKIASDMQYTEYVDQVILDVNFEGNLEDYTRLDDFIIVNPENFSKDERKKFIKLCNICPNMKVINKLYDSNLVSTAQEYIEAEEWINSIIDNLNPKYSKAQKLAVIDNAIGKRISYSPDFDTEVSDISDCRALWKIISSGYGVCNGIAKVEQYILNRVGIESEIINSDSYSHVFLKIKDIELPLANGEIVKGNTILDPTWNLASNRFGGCPKNFCISYEKVRENDVYEDGIDYNCHKNDKELQDATLNLDMQSLRNLFKSVGLTDKDGIFPVDDLVKKSKLIDEIFASMPDQNINKQLLLLSKTYPEFATCQNSSMAILSGVLLNNENFNYRRCCINRVYDKEDKDKKPILYVYADLNEVGEKFYFADKEAKQFVELSKEEFKKQFECYDKDLEKNNRN